jgi:hypothetical protein
MFFIPPSPQWASENANETKNAGRRIPVTLILPEHGLIELAEVRGADKGNVV